MAVLLAVWQLSLKSGQRFFHSNIHPEMYTSHPAPREGLKAIKMRTICVHLCVYVMCVCVCERDFFFYSIHVVDAL